MLLLLILPIVYVVARVLFFLQTYAPSNILIARVRAAPPRWRTVLMLMPLAYALIWVAHSLTMAIEPGAPAWLNLIVFVAAWDAVKISLFAILVTGRCARRTVASSMGRILSRAGLSRASISPGTRHPWARPAPPVPGGQSASSHRPMNDPSSSRPGTVLGMKLVNPADRTTTARHMAREMATLTRFRFSRNPIPRGTSL